MKSVFQLNFDITCVYWVRMWNVCFSVGEETLESYWESLRTQVWGWMDLGLNLDTAPYSWNDIGQGSLALRASVSSPVKGDKNNPDLFLKGLLGELNKVLRMAWQVAQWILVIAISLRQMIKWGLGGGGLWKWGRGLQPPSTGEGHSSPVLPFLRWEDWGPEPGKWAGISPPASQARPLNCEAGLLTAS